jgi:sterol desaturase/sphingolipid hydroxylase (fatty acid hydroxylase superfamily)
VHRDASGHRVQHESKVLWKLHSKHHAIDTPNPFSTLFIHPTDAALQVSKLQVQNRA